LNLKKSTARSITSNIYLYHTTLRDTKGPTAVDSWFSLHTTQSAWQGIVKQYSEKRSVSGKISEAGRTCY